MMTATLHACVWKDDSHTIALIDTKEIEIPQKNRLQFLQNLVGGLIDIYHHEPTGRDWVLNDEGLLDGLPLNNFARAQGLDIAGTIVEIHGQLK
jgi:hypothetical protein